MLLAITKYKRAYKQNGMFFFRYILNFFYTKFLNHNSIFLKSPNYIITFQVIEIKKTSLSLSLYIYIYIYYITTTKFLCELSSLIYFPVDRLSSGFVITLLIPFEHVLASLSHSTRYHIVIKSVLLSS